MSVVTTKTVHLTGVLYPAIKAEGDARAALQPYPPTPLEFEPSGERWFVKRFWIDLAAAENWIAFVEQANPAPVEAEIIN